MHAPTGRLQVESLEQGPVDGLAPLSPAEPGWYRLRVHARGRNILPDKVSAEPVEDYLLLAWPAPQADTDIMRTSARIGHALAQAQNMPEPQPLAPTRNEEQEAIRRRLLQG
ncbi:hypothetical protein OG548_31675 [Streptomyces sp. NBC_01356]|uniref:hypothetical protein n=1 Tax=Streptomyces sp. NBC_01356 TaxID=2903836 RepID=UPI002E31F9DB|nr:hypothetical protein [Streptomyces sp. NBC_01356]